MSNRRKLTTPEALGLFIGINHEECKTVRDQRISTRTRMKLGVRMSGISVYAAKVPYVENKDKVFSCIDWDRCWKRSKRGTNNKHFGCVHISTTETHISIGLFSHLKTVTLRGIIVHDPVSKQRLMQAIDLPYPGMIDVINRMHIAPSIAKILISVGRALSVCKSGQTVGSVGFQRIDHSAYSKSSVCDASSISGSDAFTVVVPGFTSVCTRQIDAVIARLRKNNDEIFGQKYDDNSNRSVEVCFIDYGAKIHALSKTIVVYANVLIRTSFSCS